MPISFNAPVLSSQDLDAYMRHALAVERFLADQKAEAIRWQGAQEYETLVKSGVPAQDAFSRTAPKLFYNEPRALAASAPDIGTTTGEGRILTDAASGRQFIVQPNGKISAVPQRWTGSTTVMGPGNQIYKIPLSQEELATAPRTSVPPTPPQVVPFPGGGQMIVNPSGSGTYVKSIAGEPVTIVDPNTQTTRRLTRGEYALEQAQAKAAPLLEKFKSNAAEIAAGQRKYGPDYWFNWAEPYTNQNARITQQLRDLGFDTQGQVIPGSPLADKVGLPTAAPAPAPAPTAVPPPAMTPPLTPSPTPTQAMAAPTMPSRPSRYGQESRVYFGPATETPLGTAPKVGVSLAPNEELRRVKGRLVVFDRSTRKALRYAD